MSHPTPFNPTRADGRSARALDALDGPVLRQGSSGIEWGDEWLKERAAEMNLAEGARYSEAADGANGFGTALAAASGRPHTRNAWDLRRAASRAKPCPVDRCVTAKAPTPRHAASAPGVDVGEHGAFLLVSTCREVGTGFPGAQRAGGNIRGNIQIV
jgi:hypothetical protein